MKSNIEISSTLDTLKRQKTKFDQAQLAKKQASQRLNELCTRYDAQKKRINMLAEEPEKEKMKRTSLVEKGDAIKAQRLEHLQKVDSLGHFLASQRDETTRLALELQKIDATRQHCLGHRDSLRSFDFSMI